MAKLSQLINKSYKEASEINTSFQNDQENRAEMRAKIFSRSGVSDAAKSDPAQFDPKRSAEKLRKMQEDDKILKLYKDKINDVNKGSTSDNLLQKAMGAPTGNPIDIDNYESKILERLNSNKQVMADLINKIAETHPGLLLKNSTFGGIVMNPLNNINQLFDKLNNRIISVGTKPSEALVDRIDPNLYDTIINTNAINSKMGGITYNMSVEEMSDLMSELMLTKDIKYNFNTPELLSFNNNNRPIVITNGNDLLSLYNTENLNFVFNTKVIDNNFDTKHGVVNYFKDTYARGFIEKAKELITYFKDIDKINNNGLVDFLPNTYANGFTSNFRKGYSLYKTADGIEIGNGNIKNGIFANEESKLSDVDFLPNTYANGFISNAVSLFSQYKTAETDPNSALGIVSGEFSATFANKESRLSSVDFLPNTHAYGFVSNIVDRYSYFNNSKDGKSRNDVGLGINIKNNITPEYSVDWFDNEFANGFITNAQSLYSYYMDISRNQIGDNPNNQAIMFSNPSSWLKVQNVFDDRYADGFADNARFHYSYYKMKNGKRIGILNSNIVGFFDTDYKYPDIKIQNNNDYREYGWNFTGNPILMQIPGGEGTLLLGQTNFFSNIYNVGFLKNKEFGVSDFTNYGTDDITYSDTQISTVFETLDLESKIGSSLYGNISAVDYLDNTYARGFILNSTKGYSHFQYKKYGNISDIGFLGSDISNDIKFEFGSVGDLYKYIIDNWNTNIINTSIYKYYPTLNAPRIPIGNNRGGIQYQLGHVPFYTKNSVSHGEHYNQTFNVENGQWTAYNHKYNIIQNYKTELRRESIVNESTWNEFSSKLYKSFMQVSESPSVDKIQVYDFKTENYIGVLKGSVKYIGSYYDNSYDDTFRFGKISLTRGFYEPMAVKLYNAYKNLYPESYNEMVDEFNKNSNSGFNIIGSTFNSNTIDYKIWQDDEYLRNRIELRDDAGGIIVRGVTNTFIFDALLNSFGIDSKFSQSPLTFHTEAGYIYGSITGKIPFVGGITNKITDLASTVGGSETAKLVDDTKNSLIKKMADEIVNGIKFLDPQSIEQLTKIFLGDKYTKSYAFYDPELAKNGMYGVQSAVNENLQLNTTIGFLGNRQTDAPNSTNTNASQNSKQSTGLVGIQNRIINSVENILYTKSINNINGINNTNDGLKSRLAIRGNGNAINLYNVNDTYVDVMKKQNYESSPFGKERNNDVMLDSEPSKNDLINFYFIIENYKETSTDKKSTKYLHLRADIKGMTNNVAAEWNAISYVGRPDKFYIYQGFERKGSIDFSIAPDNKNQFKVMWDKVNTLIGLCMPMEYSNDISMVPPIVKLSLGNYINGRYIVINSVNTNIESSYPWDIDDELPQIIDISMDFTILYDELPQTNLTNKAFKWHIGKQFVNTNNNSVDNSSNISITNTNNNDYDMSTGFNKGMTGN